MLVNLKTVMHRSRLELALWCAGMALYIGIILVLTAALHAGPIPPEAARESAAFRADYLSPARLFQAGLLAPLIETWLIVKGADALHTLNWRESRVLGVVALVAALMHYFARGPMSALYNAAFFVLMARIYLRNSFENGKRGENRPAAIVFILLLHIANNAIALGMIGVYAAGP